MIQVSELALIVPVDPGHCSLRMSQTCLSLQKIQFPFPTSYAMSWGSVKFLELNMSVICTIKMYKEGNQIL